MGARSNMSAASSGAAAGVSYPAARHESFGMAILSARADVSGISGVQALPFFRQHNRLNICRLSIFATDSPTARAKKSLQPSTRYSGAELYSIDHPAAGMFAAPGRADTLASHDTLTRRQGSAWLTSASGPMNFPPTAS